MARIIIADLEAPTKEMSKSGMKGIFGGLSWSWDGPLPVATSGSSTGSGSGSSGGSGIPPSFTWGGRPRVTW